MSKGIYKKRAERYFKIAKTNLVVLSNGQTFIDCDIEQVIKNAESLGLQYEIIKGEYNPKPTKKKKNDSEGTI